MDATLDTAVDAAEVRELRRSIYSKPMVSKADLTSLLDMGRKAGADVPKDYGDLLADVATDLLVNQVDPPKYISSADANWLIEQVQAGGGLSCGAEFEMLLGVLRYAVSIPPALSSFAVREIEKAIVDGHSAARGADHAAGIVTPDDVEALRNAVFAATDGASLHVSRESAEALFRIAHATSGRDNDPSFGKFRSNCVGGCHAVHAGHLQVHQCDVRPMLSIAIYRFQPVIGLSDNHHVGFALDHCRNAFPQ